jgi:hypothetical protein
MTSAPILLERLFASCLPDSVAGLPDPSSRQAPPMPTSCRNTRRPLAGRLPLTRRININVAGQPPLKAILLIKTVLIIILIFIFYLLFILNFIIIYLYFITIITAPIA